ncbi:hypothetical protein E2R66_17035 [Mucilaginibacter psychrotolerans]|uniref:Uncharacterized protein n=2 Tax=Mucilaginibacter psychrotolerans TaxID=1524096 RepID=A0A4Y8SAK4_9SPHI|nr:hypothetical protein E2R66_17035 [Mucilaginibacter psychrotolerans]
MKYAFLLAPAPIYNYIGCMKRLVNSAVVMLILVISGCYEGPYETDFTTEQPTKTDVVGFYQLKGGTVAEHSIAGSKKSTIILKPDGTYQIQKIPNVFGGEEAERSPEISATGRWKIDTVRNKENILGHKTPCWGITLTNIDNNFETWVLMGNSSPYELIIPIDDLILGQAIIFSRE